MSEAKRRSAERAASHAPLDQKLRDLGVDTGAFGFYDQPAFMAQEALDRRFLDNYALWVQSRPRSADDDARARAIVPRLAAFLADLFEQEDMQRSCVHVSSMMPRILDRLGVWSFALKGSMIMSVPAKDIVRAQAVKDLPATPGQEIGHSWVVAPPFVIVDPTIRLQNPPGDAINAYIPPIVAVEDAPLTKPTVDDVVSVALRAHTARQEGREDSQLHHRAVPHLREFGREFPSRQITIGQLRVRYVPVAVRISDVPLELINGGGDRLRGSEVWNDYVAKAFAEYIVG
ncbi:hypothetical protein [Sphingomonas soli]|uniref:hypothetical protein n=1 Tax=Sphingomonas soli TaxID=266127 RepID=UPI00082A8785|nr:hypothetical protein [Sphingomonas soli]